MRVSLLLPCLFFFVSACTDEPKTETKAEAMMYPDIFRENFKGDPVQIELINHRIDSLGNMTVDSIYREVGEWKDGYLQKYTEYDSLRRKQTYAYYTYHPNGKVKEIVIDQDGKKILRSLVILDSVGKIKILKFFDVTGKPENIYTNITESKAGMILTATQRNGDSVVQGTVTGDYNHLQIIRSVTMDTVGKIVYTAGYTFGEYGDVIADTTTGYGKDSTTTTIRRFKYEDHDSLKNWLTKTELNAAGTPVKVIKRSIIYAVKE